MKPLAPDNQFYKLLWMHGIALLVIVLSLVWLFDKFWVGAIGMLLFAFLIFKWIRYRKQSIENIYYTTEHLILQTTISEIRIPLTGFHSLNKTQTKMRFLGMQIFNYDLGYQLNGERRIHTVNIWISSNSSNIEEFDHILMRYGNSDLFPNN